MHHSAAPAEDIRSQIASMIEKHGWAMIMTPYYNEGRIAAYTRGLGITYKHPELEIIYPVNYDRAHGLMIAAIELIKEGQKLEVGKTYAGILKAHLVKIVATADADTVRLVFPDKQGSFTNPEFSWQETYPNHN